jgi:hypothetical protein
MPVLMVFNTIISAPGTPEEDLNRNIGVKSIFDSNSVAWGENPKEECSEESGSIVNLLLSG